MYLEMLGFCYIRLLIESVSPVGSSRRYIHIMLVSFQLFQALPSSITCLMCL